ncbi:MAG TPA: ester cyclase [Thermomicrobiales bacterium]|jgi:steroid delta-isomerase-like uncharacterized protein
MNISSGSQARSVPSRLDRPAGGRPRAVVAAFCLMVGLTIAALAMLYSQLALASREPVAVLGDREAGASAALVAEFYAEVWNGGQVASAGRFVTADHVYHDPTLGAVPSGPTGVERAVVTLRQGFPDLVISLDDVVVAGDRVTVRFTARGTQRGPYLGAAGTGRVVEVTGVAIHRLVDGRIAETWVWWDTYGLALRIGLVVVPIADLDGGNWEGAPSGGLSGHAQ